MRPGPALGRVASARRSPRCAREARLAAAGRGRRRPAAAAAVGGGAAAAAAAAAARAAPRGRRLAGSWAAARTAWAAVAARARTSRRAGSGKCSGFTCGAWRRVAFAPARAPARARAPRLAVCACLARARNQQNRTHTRTRPRDAGPESPPATSGCAPSSATAACCTAATPPTRAPLRAQEPGRKRRRLQGPQVRDPVLVNVLGRMEKRYRFQAGDHIHVACQGQACRETKQRHATMCHLVCGECMNADPHPAHLGMAGECRACVAETRDRKLTAISEGIRGGPRDKFAEAANENSYLDAAKFAEVEDEENEAKRARNEAGGGGRAAARRCAQGQGQALASRSGRARRPGRVDRGQGAPGSLRGRLHVRRRRVRPERRPQGRERRGRPRVLAERLQLRGPTRCARSSRSAR